MNTQILITFHSTPEVDDYVRVKVFSQSFDDIINRGETFATTRTNPGQVTISPIVNTQASLYGNSFNADYNIGGVFSVSIAANVVTITLTPGGDFTYVDDVEISGDFATWEYAPDPPPDIERQILAMSPHYLSVSLTNPSTSAPCVNYTIDLYVWRGLKGSPPGIPAYSWTKGNPTASVGYDEVNIANVINGLIGEPIPVKDVNTTTLVNLPNQVWIQAKMSYDGGPASVLREAIAFKGYGLGMSGKNPNAPTTKILQSAEEGRIYRNGFALIPILTDAEGDVTIKSFPDSQIDVTLSPTINTDSLNRATHVLVSAADASSDQYIEVTYNSRTIYLDIIDECRYAPVEVQFINRFGQMQMFTFFKAVTPSTSITKETYDAHGGQPLDGFHQMRDYNVNAQEKIRVSSGFLDQSENVTVRELLYSSRCWLFDNGSVTPMRVLNSSLEYKTREKDRLINYELELGYAFDAISTV